MLLVASAERLVAYNSTAHQVWSALAEGRTPADAASALAASFGLDPDEASRHVESIVAHWSHEGLLAPGSRPDSAPEATNQKPMPSTPASWAARWACRFSNHVVEFAVEDARRASFLRQPFSPLEVESGAPDIHIDTRIEVRALDDDTSVVLRDGRESCRIAGLAGLKEGLHQTLIEFMWPDRPISALMHASAVALHDMGIAFPAPSGSGKSTLVAHLIAKGFAYLADDLTPLDASGCLLPWPVPVSVKQGSWSLLDHLHPELRSSPAFKARETQARLFAPRGSWTARPTSLQALIFPKYVRSGRLELDAIRPFEALVRLRESGLWLGYPLTEERVRRFLSWLESTPAYTMRYGELADATGEIVNLSGSLAKRSASVL
jgi:hypothetical protein